MPRSLLRHLSIALTHVRRVWLVAAVAIAVTLVSIVTVDVGPVIRSRAEAEASAFIDRPVHIGRLGVNIGRGGLVIEDLVVEGLTPAHDPWLVAGHIELSLTWNAIFGRELLVDTVEMTDWRLVVESYPNAIHNWPRLGGPPRPPRTGPRLFTTTIQNIRASRGHLIVRDFGSSWGLDAPNLEIAAVKDAEYHGTMTFNGGTLLIQQYEPMWAHFSTAFAVRDGTVVLEDMALNADGAQLRGSGTIDVANFPEATYQLTSRHQLPRARAIFYARDQFRLSGEGDFAGTVRMLKGGYEVKGEFASAEAGYDDFRFPNFRASVVWLPTSLDVTSATAGFYGGTVGFSYLLEPLGQTDRRADATWDVQYHDVDLTTFTTFLETKGLRLAGRASGRHVTRWTLGAFERSTGEGTLTAAMPAGVTAMGPAVPADAEEAAGVRAMMQGPFSPHISFGPLPVAGDLAYTFTGDAIEFAPSRFATEDTFVAFDGRTAWGPESRLPFHVWSRNWQESHRFLAGIMTMVAAPTGAVPIDGVGEFDGVMLGDLASPRVEGSFTGQAMRAWNVSWGTLEGKAVIEDSYAFVSEAAMTRGASRLDVDGQFALGYPRQDGGTEIDARIRASEWPLTDFRAAFELHDYPVFGALGGEIRLSGRYQEPFGFGRITLDRGTAYDEPFASGVASLRFEGPGVRLDGLEVKKAGSTITGAAYLAWAGTYSFNADGRRLAVDALDLTYFPTLPPLTGFVDLSATGSGTFDEPRYDLKVSVSDLFIGDEGIGEMTAQVGLRGLTVLYSFDVASPRLAASGSGQFGLTDAGEIEMTVRLSDTSLDPYARVLMPTLSPYTTAIVGGSVRVWGEVYTPDGLHVASTIDDLRLRLFDYELKNRGELTLGLDGQIVHIDAFGMTGDRTSLDVTGRIDLERDVVALSATGEANLAVIQGVLPEVRGSGRAEISATIGGTTATPTISGNALMTDGRLRTFAFPHALEAINGIVAFDATAVRLDGLRARLADGTVQFGGRMGLSGLVLTDYDLTITGHDLRLRYPEGLRSLVEAALTVQGPADAPVLGGSVLVRNAVWTPAFDGTTNVFGSSAPAAPAVAAGPAVPGAATAPATPVLRYDVRLVAPSTLRIENDVARIVASADLTLRGTPERPQVFGRADIEHGEVRFEGRRYVVSRGSLDFTNPDRIQPFFDVEADTRVRVPGQTYRVTLRIAGTTERLQPEFTSDPPLPSADVLSLLLSDRRPTGDVEVSSVNAPNQREVDLLQSRATRALTGALSAEVGKVVQETFGVDTFQITPLLVDPYQQVSGLAVNPAARVTIGKRLSDRIYLTYVRSLSSSERDQIILLEYDQSDTMGWVLSQNEDGTYALEVRKRVAF
ncbi:MAG: translocation/assembly module TamB [Acidobacteria bacterium]|nr:translocation/assembly module TamB [Acidobacteriota bacterium]